MNSVREVLNKIKWTGDLSKTRIWYIHRGAPDDTRVVSGKDISDIGKSFLSIGEKSIPHHRVFQIKYIGKIVFKRSIDK